MSTDKSNKICVVSIVSLNYLAYARVLAKSVKSSFEGADFLLLIVDRKTSKTELITKELPFDFMWAEDLGIENFEGIAYKYDILELNTGLKPSFLKYALSKGYEAAIYFDPDIFVFSNPEPITTGLSSHSILITPHALNAVMDGYRPSDIDFLRNGVYNLGFIAVKSDVVGLKFLDWWEDRCLSFCFNDPALGTFVDQKWIDLVPCYFESVLIIKHKGCNVAYWNLHERNLSSMGKKYCVDNQLLIFFHFSGIDAFNSLNLSKYQSRHNLESIEIISNLVVFYCESILNESHRDYIKFEYTFGKTSNGTLISQVMRRAYVFRAQLELNSPFDSNSTFQKELHQKQVSRSRDVKQPKLNTLNFNQKDRKVELFNYLLRLLVYFLGIERVQMIFRYIVFLSRGSNFAAVLLKRQFNVVHKSQK